MGLPRARERVLIMRSALVCLLTTALCAPAHGFWQSRDSNYNSAPGGGGAPANPVTFNSKATADEGHTGVTSLTMNTMTVGTGTDRALILLLGIQNLNPALVTATWDSGGTNQAMTLIASHIDGAICVGIFARLNPTSGNKTLSVTWSGAREADAMALDFTNVNQTGGATSFPNTAGNDSDTAGSNPATVTVNSFPSNYTVATFATDWLWSAGSATKTELYLQNGLSAMAYEGQRAVGGGAVTYNVSVSASGHVWSGVAIDIAHD